MRCSTLPAAPATSRRKVLEAVGPWRTRRDLRHQRRDDGGRAGEGREAHGDRLAFVQRQRRSAALRDGASTPIPSPSACAISPVSKPALAEAYRVLKPGGRFLCLEFSRVEVPLLDTLYDAYSFNAIPALGALVAGDSASYRYLVESIRRFPDQKSFMRLIENAGFERVRYRNLTGGIAAIHSALATVMRPIDVERDRRHGAVDQGGRRARLVGRARASGGRQPAGAARSCSAGVTVAAPQERRIRRRQRRRALDRAHLARTRPTSSSASSSQPATTSSAASSPPISPRSRTACRPSRNAMRGKRSRRRSASPSTRSSPSFGPARCRRLDRPGAQGQGASG